MKKQILFTLIFLFLNTFTPSYSQYAYPYYGQYAYPVYGQVVYPYNGQYIYPNYGQVGYSNLSYSTNNFGKKHPVLNLLTNVLGSGYLNNVGSGFGNSYINSYVPNQQALGNSQQAFISGFNSTGTQNLIQENSYLGSDLIEQGDSE